MPRRVENVGVFYQRSAVGFLSGKNQVYLQVGKKRMDLPQRRSESEMAEMSARSKEMPVRYLTVGDRAYWRFADKWYTDSDGLLDTEIRAWVIAQGLRLKKRISEANTIASAGRVPDGGLREFIPVGVRHEVWERDSGQCRACGGQSDLQIDHLIPVSMGGANTVNNLQILCGPCNRTKGASIA